LGDFQGCGSKKTHEKAPKLIDQFQKL